MATFQPNKQSTVLSSKSYTFVGNNTAGIAVPLFRITGTIEVVSLYGIVTTVLGANHTAAYWRLNDQTAQVNITLNTGTTLNAAPGGSLIIKTGLATAALTLKSSAAGGILEPTTLETTVPSPFIFTKKTAANTDIEYVYSTTDAPTSGVTQFFCEWIARSDDAAVTPQ